MSARKQNSKSFQRTAWIAVLALLLQALLPVLQDATGMTFAAADGFGGHNICMAPVSGGEAPSDTEVAPDDSPDAPSASWEAPSDAWDRLLRRVSNPTNTFCR